MLFSVEDLLGKSLGLVVGPALGKPRDQKRENISWGTGRLAGVITGAGAFLSGRPAGEIITWVALGLAVLGFSLGLVVGPALGEPRDQKRENISWGTHHLGCFRIGSAGVLTGRVAGDITRAGG